MSCLKLYWPQTFSLYAPADIAESVETADETGPVILSFPRRGSRRTGPGRTGQGRIDLLNRARLIYENRCCPECRRAAVVPVDSEPALMFANHMPVPGIGTLSGFACECCGHEWSI